VSVKVITEPLSPSELISICSERAFEGLVVAGIREPDPLMWACDLKKIYPERAVRMAILHSPAELNEVSLPLAARGFRETELAQQPDSHSRRKILVDQPGRQLIVDGIQQNLSPAEFRLFLFFIRYCEVVFSRRELLHRTRPSKSAVDPRIVDVLIGRLRSKIDQGKGAASHFTTFPGIGYQFLRHDDEFIDGFTHRSFESWPCCESTEERTPS